MNDYQFKVVKLQGDFIWHDHKDTDETFIVIEGNLRIDFRNGAVHVQAGEMFDDADDMCIYALGDVCDGTDVERLLDRALADRRTDYVNMHTARPGCFLCRVERI